MTNKELPPHDPFRVVVTIDLPESVRRRDPALPDHNHTVAVESVKAAQSQARYQLWSVIVAILVGVASLVANALFR